MLLHLALFREQLTSGFTTRSGITWSVQPQNTTRGLEISDLGNRGILLSV